MQARLAKRVIQTLLPRDTPYEVVDVDLTGFLIRVQPSGIMTYYFSYRNQRGRRQRYRIGKHGTISPAQARDKAIRLSARVIAGEDVQAAKKREVRDAELAKYQTLSGFLQHKYGPWVCSQRKTGEATVKRIRSNFQHLLERPIGEISVWAVEKWRSEELKAGKARTTINRDIAALNACLSKAIKWELLTVHPLENLRPIKTDGLSRVRYLTQDERLRLGEALVRREETIRRKRNSANEWRRARHRREFPDLSVDRYVDHLWPMVLLAINTGLRRGELFHLQWSDVDFSGNYITVRGGTAKSGHTRHVPLHEEAARVLRRWHMSACGSTLVFPGKDGNRLTNVRTAWRRVLRDAGISEFRWHDLRHHFASQLVMAGVDLNTVRELLGHSDIAMTLRYAHLSSDHKAEAVGKLIGSGDIAVTGLAAPAVSKEVLYGNTVFRPSRDST